jgi:hypothetical protein
VYVTAAALAISIVATLIYVAMPRGDSSQDDSNVELLGGRN